MDEYTEPNRDSAALLTIDTQNDFTLPGAPAEIEGTAAAVPRIRRVVQAFRSTGSPIVHVVRLYQEDGANVDRCRKGQIESGAEIVRPGSEGAELVQELKPSPEVSLDADRLLDGGMQEIGPQESLMYKPRWGAFYRTKLDEYLRGQSVDTLVVCGCNFPNCPRTTIYEASERDYRLVFVPDATSGVYERAVEELANIDVRVSATRETVEWATGSAD
jgi:nicotinamidase-related amidase